MKSKIASSSATRWNFSSRVVGTFKNNYDSLLDCLTKNNDHVKESCAITAATLLQYMKSDLFIFYLELFNSILINVSILFNQLQSRQTDISKVRTFIEHFKRQLQILKNKYEESDQQQSHITEAMEVIKNIDEDISARLDFKGHLMAEALFDNSRFAEFNIAFPVATFQHALDAYPFLNGNDLREELEMFYSREEFRDLKTISDILNCI